ncbi:putative aminotransferase [Zancudomyces culisetae]|uniref:Putative aminotransferase n=1 Tax=Zancudomyces culisetae TaxID=1213189 RepID=A0A1R1PQJ4_ZANCU|nr:putative aminotransferase [Zancudomyces culisetae]|eukprot:OMH83142.1 putative aminotransferase [Zancudomyces culisetae]
MFGGKVKYVPLRMDSKLDPKNNITSSRDWKLDIDELESKMSPKSRLLIINTPQNPTGKVFSMEELGKIAEVAKKHNLIVISDEVYEYLCYDKEKHVSIAKIPGMWERTIVVGSLGKLFGVTGWRIGWLIGDQSLISACLNFHTYTLFCSPSPLQEAGAIAFREAGSHDYYALTREQYLHRRNKLMSAFDAINMPYSIPQGAYYLLVNAEKLKIPEDYPFPDYILKRSKKKGFKLAYFFTKEIGITAIPAQEFYCEAHGEIAENYLRFSFCKTDKVLDMVSQRLKRTIQYM